MTVLYRCLHSPWFTRSLRWGLGGLFVATGLVKLSHPAAFAIQIEKYGLLPATWLDPASYALPLAEIIAGLAAMAGRRSGIAALGALLLVFIGAIAYALWTGLDIPCGCFSLEDTARHGDLALALFRDLLMLAGCGWLLIPRTPHGTTGSAFSGGHHA